MTSILYKLWTKPNCTHLIDFRFSGDEVSVRQRDCPEPVASHGFDDILDGAFSGRLGELVDSAALAEYERALGHDDLGRALCEDSVASGLERDDRTHRLPGRVEGVNFCKSRVLK